MRGSIVNKYKGKSREAQEKRKRYWSCDRKRGYLTEDDAYQHGQKAYRCRFCGLWHRSGASAKFYNQINAGRRVII